MSNATSSVVGGGGAAGDGIAFAGDDGDLAPPPLATKKSVSLRRSLGRSSSGSALVFACSFSCFSVITPPCAAFCRAARLVGDPAVSSRRAAAASTMSFSKISSVAFGFAAASRSARARSASAFFASSSANARSARYTCSGGNWFVSSLCTARFTLRFTSEASFSSAGIVSAVFRSSAFNRSTLHRTHRPTSQVSPLPGDRSCNGAMRVVARGLTTTALTARSTSPETRTGSHGGSAGDASTDPTETPRRFRDVVPWPVPPAGGTSHAGHCAIASCGPRR
mmetsp:Transcript_15218/g.64245  ORF Transcript_15218/g.64245 Transcript_15218/m.64245 type:complete len:280 (-) Transcript_15218:35-874(-)